MNKTEKWYREKIAKIADIVNEIQMDSETITFERILTDVQTWESSKIRE